MQHIMVKCNYGANHSELRNIAKEINEEFLQFFLFSETWFIQYEQDTNENIQNLLIQAEHVINLLFMKDFSYLVMLCSKELQRFDVLPHYAMNVCKKLKQQLQHGMESFQKGETPSAISIEKGNAVKQYTIWGDFKQNITKITDDQTYKNVRLLVPSERGRVTRSGTIYMVVTKKDTKI